MNYDQLGALQLRHFSHVQTALHQKSNLIARNVFFPAMSVHGNSNVVGQRRIVVMANKLWLMLGNTFGLS